MGRRIDTAPYEWTGKKPRKDRPETPLLNAMAFLTPPNAFTKRNAPCDHGDEHQESSASHPRCTWVTGHGAKLYGAKGIHETEQGFCPTTETYSNVTLTSGQHSWRYVDQGEAGRAVVCNVVCIHCLGLRQIHNFWPVGFTDDGRLIEVCSQQETWQKFDEPCGFTRIGNDIADEARLTESSDNHLEYSK